MKKIYEKILKFILGGLSCDRHRPLSVHRQETYKWKTYLFLIQLVFIIWIGICCFPIFSKN